MTEKTNSLDGFMKLVDGVAPNTGSVEEAYKTLTPQHALEKTREDYAAEAYEAAEEARNVDGDRLYQAGVENNHIVTQIMQWNRMQGHNIDPNFRIEAKRLEQDLNEKGIPMDWAGEFGDEVWSEEAYQAKLQVLSERAANEKLLTEAGGRGLGYNLLTMVSDPIGFAVDAIAAPLSAGTKGSKLARLGKAALGAGTASAVVGSAQGMVNPDYDGNDVLGDFVLGAGFGMLVEGGGMLLRAEERKELFDGFLAATQRKADEVDDSLSAARTAGSRVDELDSVYTGLGEGRAKAAREHLEDLEDELGTLKSAVYGTLRIDAHRHVETQGIAGKTLLRTLHSDPTGVAGDAVNHTGAVERANRVRNTHTTQWRRGADGNGGWEGALGEWINAKHGNSAKGWVAKEFSREDRIEFARMVGEAALTGTKHADPAVNKAVQVLRETGGRVWDEGVAAGVNGMKKGGGQMDFTMSRIFRKDMWHFIKGLSRSGDTRPLEEPLTELFTAAVRGGRTELGLPLNDEVTEKVARAMAARVMGAKDDAMGGIDRMTELRLDYLDDVLEEAGLTKQQIDEVVSQFVPEKTEKNAVPSDRLKQRLPLDMNVSIKMENGENLRLLDLYETNAELVTDGYIREMGGHIALAQSGYKSWREVQGMITQLHKTEKSLDGDGERLASKYLRHILGRPMVESEVSKLAPVGRLVKDANFLSSLGSVAYSMIAENGKILGLVGLRAAMKQIPRLRQMTKQAMAGKLDDEMARQIAAYVGIGNSRLRNQVSLRQDDFENPAFTNGVLGKIDRAQQVAKQAQTLLSGLGPINDVQQLFTVSSLLQTVYDGAKKGEIHKSLRSRLRDYGLKNGEINDFMTHMADKAEVQNGVLRNPALDTMPMGLQLRVAEALNRAARHVIQDLDVGAVPEFMHEGWGKLATQFQTYTIGGYTRHTLHGLAKHDKVAAVGFASSMALATAGYVAMAHINYANNDEKRKLMLDEKNLAKMAFSRSSDATIIPALWDTTKWLLGEKGDFTHSRSSGYATNFVTGNPTYSTISKLAEIMKIPTNALRTDKDVTREQVQALMSMIWANRLPGLLNLQHMVSQEFQTANELDQEDKE